VNNAPRLNNHTNQQPVDNLGNYKFPFIDIISGAPKVVFKALAAIVASVNGARGGTKIPSSDKKSVYNFVVNYYKKFDKEPPEFSKSENSNDNKSDNLVGEEYEERASQREYQAKYSVCPFNIKADSIMDDGTFEGYASVFGGNPDSYGDIIAPGAFGKTLVRGGRNRNGIGMLWYHDVKEPIGVWLSIIQDEKGLKVRGQLNLDVQRAREIHSLMKQGAIKGLSIGWDFLKDTRGKIIEGTYEWKDQANNIRLLKQVELWEISPVTFPAKVNANITKVKSVMEATTSRELEDALRESGLSKAAAQYMIKLCKASLRESERIIEGNSLSLFTGKKHEDNENENLHTESGTESGNEKSNVKSTYEGLLTILKSMKIEDKIHKMCN